MHAALPPSFQSKGGSKYPPRSSLASQRRSTSSTNTTVDAYTNMKRNADARSSLSAANHSNSNSNNNQNNSLTGLISARLTPRKIENLASLIEKTNVSNERNKQCEITKQTMIHLHSPPQQSRAVSQAVKLYLTKTITAFFADKNQLVNQTTLTTLESAVARKCKVIPDEIQEEMRMFNSGLPRHAVPKLALGGSGNSSNRERDMKLPESVGNDWNALTIANAIEYQDNIVKTKIKDGDKKRVQRMKLDEQVFLQKVAKDNERRDDGIAKQLMRREHDEYMVKQEALKIKKAKETEVLKGLYQSEVEGRAVRKMEERRVIREESLADAQAVHLDLQRNSVNKALSKSLEKTRYETMLLESQRLQQFKKLEKLKEVEADALIGKEMKKRLDVEEENKKNAQLQRQARYDVIGKNHTSGAGASEREKERITASIIEREAQLKLDRDQQRLESDKLKLVQDKVLMKKLNDELINEKKVRIREEGVIEDEFVRKAKSYNQIILDKEASKIEKRRTAALLNKSLVLAQASENKQKALTSDTTLAVSATERLINRSAFDKLHNDAEMMERIRAQYVAVRPGDTMRGGEGGGGRVSQSDRGGSGVAGLLADPVEGRGGSPNKRSRGRKTKMRR